MDVNLFFVNDLGLNIADLNGVLRVEFQHATCVLREAGGDDAEAFVLILAGKWELCLSLFVVVVDLEVDGDD